MKRGLAALGIATVFALSACGNPTTAEDEIIDEPIPGEEQPLPDDDLNDDVDDDMNDDLDDDLDEDTEEETEG
ncbi:hypothetical protein [Microcella sp.]|uniref:hypothetical protein n=1 Tax=Microcella sp. TaxID=1913979 RepID=UPI00256DC901|nr:hypothetical protein [Microcella sp.]MBX9471297.1 hypothetical protein [Microcella sp.]